MATVIRSVVSLGQTALSPTLLAPLLATILYGPASVRTRALAALRASPETLQFALRLVLALGAVRVSNRLLSSVAANNWRVRGQPGWDWSKEIAVVTGGCSGIGRAVAEGLARKGVRVAVLDIQEPPADLHYRIKYFRCDVTMAGSIASAGTAIREALGHPSILVNNAGMGSRRRILDTTQAELDKIFKVNLLSHWATVQEFVPAMIERQKGHVVTVASMTAYMTLGMISDYSASKAGAVAFHEGLTQELKHVYNAPNVATTLVVPNWVLTPMVSAAAKQIEKGHGKLLSVDEVAGPILAQIESRRGGHLILPERLGMLAGIRGWPTWVAVGLRDVVTTSIRKATMQ